MAELLTQDLSVKADTILLVREANLRLVPGELVALLGPNGAGKTSLLKAALGLEKRSAGLATLDGVCARHVGCGPGAGAAAYGIAVRPGAGHPSTVR